VATVPSHAYNLFERREGLRWRWTVLVASGTGDTLLAEYTGLAWTPWGANRAGRAVVKRDHLARR
jgi:hypothetical protein